jgi:hypothetical protein
MKTLSSLELSNLHFYAALLFALAGISVIIGALLLSLVGDIDFPLFQISICVIIGYSFLTFAITVVALVIEGARNIHTSVRILSYGLYLYSLFSLYISGCLIYIVAGVATFFNYKSDKLIMALAIAVAVATLVGTFVIIFTTVKLPHMMLFIRDIEEYPKAQKLRMYRYICQGAERAKGGTKVVQIRSVESDAEENDPILRKKIQTIM